MNHEQTSLLLGAYALDAVDRDEGGAIKDHLRECPRCRAELADHRDTAAMLASSGSDAPRGLWDAIAASIDAAPPPMRLRLEARPSPRRHRPSPTALVAAAAAVVALAGVAGVAGRVASLNHQVAGMRSHVQGQGIQEAALAALADPAARTVTLHGTTGTAEVGVVVLPDGRAFVVRTDLPTLASAMTYQLWGVVGGHTKVSLGLLGAKPGVTEFHLDPASVSLLAITVESAGGVASTDHPAVAWAPLSV